MSKLLEIFRNNLNFFIEERHWGQADLARAMKTDPSNLNRYFRGKMGPTVETLGQMAQALGVRPYELLLDTAEKGLPRIAIALYRDIITAQSQQIIVLMNEIERLQSQLDQAQLSLRKKDCQVPPKPKK